jgi:ankyrin repeat protein
METDFQQLAKYGNLNSIDPNLLTQENLTIKDNNGSTPLHWAARKGHLNQIPEKFLTQENLTLRNLWEQTPLHFAAIGGYLNQIPYPILKQNFELIKKTKNIETIMAETKIRYTQKIVSKLIKPQTH